MIHGTRRSFTDSPSLGIRTCVMLALAALASACSADGAGTASGTDTNGAGGNGSGGAAAGGMGGSSVGGNGGSGTGTSASSASSASSTGSGMTTCTGDADCVGNPGGGVCDTQTGACVACLPSNDPCPAGQYCDPAKNKCAQGCGNDADCPGQYCDTTTHACVSCTMDDHCPAGQVCFTAVGACTPGCTPTHACAAGLSCCTGQCVNIDDNIDHCGACDKECDDVPNAGASCTLGVCGAGACLPAFADCNQNSMDGCEWNTILDGPCACIPGQTQSCYQGTPGSLGVGPCKPGTQTCKADGTGFGPCVGQIVPKAEICANSIDEDCNGTVDDANDADGDGWTRCNGDCCDSSTGNCGGSPKLVNPGAIEVAGDGVDNDCDGVVDNALATNCSTAVKFTGLTGLDVAKAMDLCQTTTANPLPAQKKWGVIQSDLRLADGTLPTGTALTDLQNKQTAVSTLFGNTVTPKKNQTFAIISSGMARDANDTGWVVPASGTYLTTAITFPGAGPLATYLNAHGGNLLPGQCGANTCPVGTGANDSVDVRLQIRVPTNAQGFSYDFRFYSGEYYTFQCTQFNDYYLAILTSGVGGLPADKNISFDSLNNAVSVNNGFFQDCGGNGKGCGTCPFGTASLAGTGFDQVSGGSTEWLTTDTPIVPGETITIDLTVFDVGDHGYDTLILLDNFRWSLSPVVLGTHT